MVLQLKHLTDIYLGTWLLLYEAWMLKCSLLVFLRYWLRVPSGRMVLQ